MTAQALDAIATDREVLLALGDSLRDDEWSLPSDCAGWTVQDVVAHMATVFLQIADPSSLPSPDPDDVERTADRCVDSWRGRSPREVLDGYRTASEVGLAALRAMQAPEMLEVVVPLANLGSHPVHLLADALAFDHYTHIRIDLLQPLGPIDRPAPPSDELRLVPTIGWMLAGLPQMCGDRLAWLDAPVGLVLEGPGGGEHHLEPRAGGVAVCDGLPPDRVATIRSSTADFVVWGTKRRDWRTLELRIQGNAATAAKVLDAIDVI